MNGLTLRSNCFFYSKSLNKVCFMADNEEISIGRTRFCQNRPRISSHSTETQDQLLAITKKQQY